MRGATPRNSVFSAGMDTALKGAAAVAADDFSRKRVAVLALSLTFFDTLFSGALDYSSFAPYSRRYGAFGYAEHRRPIFA